mgnify:CR=1 FL=1
MRLNATKLSFKIIFTSLKRSIEVMKLLKILTLLIFAFSISVSLKAKEIKMGKADWDTGFFQAEIYKKALEKMGYKVSGPTVMKPQVFYVAAAAGDMDLWVNGWFENHNTYVTEAMGKVKPVGYVVEKGGFCLLYTSDAGDE